MADLDQIQQLATTMAHSHKIELIDMVYGYLLIGVPSVLGMGAISLLASAAHQAGKELKSAATGLFGHARTGGNLADKHNQWKDRQNRKGTTVPLKSEDGTARHPDSNKPKVSPDDLLRPKPKLLNDEIKRGIGNAGAEPLHAPGGGSRMNGVTLDAAKFSEREAHEMLDQVQSGGFINMSGKDGDQRYYRKIHQDGVGERFIDATDFTAERGLRDVEEGRYDGMPVNTRADIMQRAYNPGGKR